MTRLSYNSRRSKVRKTIKDYLIPIVGIGLILIIIFSIFSMGENGEKDNNKLEDVSSNISGDLSVTLDDDLTEAYIISGNNEKSPISGSTNLLKGQKLIVKEGTTTIDATDLGVFKLNKMGELFIDDNGFMKLISSDLWIKADKTINISTIFTKIKISAGSVVSISQNEALSTIYVISGTADISNLVGKKALLGNLQVLTISNQDASNDDVNLTIKKDNIDDFFKNSEWYVKNNGDSFLSNSSSTLSGSTGSTVSLEGEDLNQIIQLDDLRDESVVSSSKISISGKYFNDFVSYIELNGKRAKIDIDNKTFSFSDVILSNKENDLVIKLYDSDDNIISKVVYTIYYNGALESDNVDEIQTPKKSTGFELQNYQVDGSKFIFTAPGASPYTTTESLVTIRGQVPKGVVTKVVVNGFTLGSFNGTTWRYHADESNDNLRDGTNVYEVSYYGEGGKIIYTNSFIIIKKTKLINLEEPSSEISTGKTN